MDRWPDLEAAWVAYLADASGERVGTETPGDLAVVGKFVRVSRGPGADDTVTDSPLLDVEVFVAGKSAREARPFAMLFAGEVRSWVLAAKARRIGGVVRVLVDRVETVAGPVYVDYRNPQIARCVMTFRVEYRG